MVIVQHRLLIGGTIHYTLSDAQLRVEHVSQVLYLLHEVVLDGSIQLSDTLGAVSVGNAIL